MKKFSFKAVALAASFIASGAAFAANQNLDATTATPAVYASEIKIDATNGTAVAAGAAATLATDAKLGASFGNDVTAYVRFDLSSGVFKGNPSFAINDSAAAAASVSISQGGDGASYVIFAVTPTAGNKLLGTTVGTMTPNATGYTVKDQTAVSLTYRLFETLTAAVNPSTSNTLKSASATHVKFSPAYSMTVAAQSLTADVNAANGAYFDFTPAGTSKLAKLTTAVDGTVAIASGAAATAGALLADKTKLTLNGDFTYTKLASSSTYNTAKVFLSTSATCASADKVADSLNATTAVFGDGAASLTAANLVNYVAVCVIPTASTEIGAGSYTLDAAYTAQTGYSVANSTGAAAGTISRNGATLVAPITNQPAGWYSRLVLNNTSSVDRTYTVKAVSETGNVITLSGAAASGTLKANTTTVADLQTLVTAVGGLPRYSLVVTINAPASAVNGAYQIANGTTGMISNYPLVAK